MLKNFFYCTWICIVTSISFYIGSALSLDRVVHPSSSQEEIHIESKTTDSINVPLFQNGDVAGYLVTNFIYNIDVSDSTKLSLPPDIFILDEAFHALFSQKIEPNHLEKYQIAGLKDKIKERVNQRLGGPYIKDILIKDFNYIPKREVPQ